MLGPLGHLLVLLLDLRMRVRRPRRLVLLLGLHLRL
jgi:hypothetical protein